MNQIVLAVILCMGFFSINSDTTENIYYAVNDGGIESSLEIDLQDWVYEMCEEYNIPGYEKLILAQLYCESEYQKNLVSCTDDYGMAQINICNHKRLKNDLGVTDFLDAKQSIRCGVYMMAECLKKNEYDESKALVAYNAGQSKVDKGINSSQYSERILQIRDNMEQK